MSERGDLILVEREVTRGGTTFMRNTWVKPDELKPGDKTITDPKVIEKFKAEREKRKVYEQRFRDKKRREGELVKPGDPMPPPPPPLGEKKKPVPEEKPLGPRPDPIGEWERNPKGGYYSRAEVKAREKELVAWHKESTRREVIKNAELFATPLPNVPEAKYLEHQAAVLNARDLYGKTLFAPDGPVAGQPKLTNRQVREAASTIRADPRAGTVGENLRTRDARVAVTAWLQQPVMAELMNSVASEMAGHKIDPHAKDLPLVSVGAGGAVSWREGLPAQTARGVAKVAVTNASVHGMKGVVGWYNGATRTMTLIPSTAAELVEALHKGEASQWKPAEREAVNTLVHELGHAASNPDYKYENRSYNCPHKAIEEATTEMLARSAEHRLGAMLGVAVEPETLNNPRLLVDSSPRDRRREAITGDPNLTSYPTVRRGEEVRRPRFNAARSTAYATWTQRFAGVATLASDATTDKEAQRAIEQWSLAVKRTRGTMRYNYMADAIVGHHLADRSHPAYPKARELVANVLMKYMGGKDDWYDSGIGDFGCKSKTLDENVRKAVEKALKSTKKGK